MAKSFTLNSGILYGFQRLHVFMQTGAGTVEKFVVEGREGEGGTQEIKLNGLSKEPTQVSASDVVYYQNAQGTGKVTADLTLLDVPMEVEAKWLGRTITTDGNIIMGKDTKAPKMAIIAESHTANGDPVYIALLNGVLSRPEGFSAKTMDADEEFKPEGAAYTFSAQNYIKSGSEFDGGVVVTRIGDGPGKDKLFEAVAGKVAAVKTSDK
ncbi:phage tail protein [Weissella ceti]|uniref:Phage tail protein n=1 Tax=Weissella ceti TaxID=759620 RepID=A0ABT3E4B1_9LACO|nr:major tail protein [Weissella ceti]MCW0953246.1 phage tail protein [Weissella ceti]QVK12762.1 phage tail protein [Weissella ceti]